MSSPAPDVLIVGAGIVGAACALECARAGLSVTVVENSIPGGGATAAGMGHITVMDDSEPLFALTRYSQRLWQALAGELPREAEYLPCGTLWVAAGEEEMAEVRRKHEFFTTHGVAAEILDARLLAEAEPNLRPGLAGGLLVPGDSVVYPPVIARWLLDQSGAKVIRGEAGVAGVVIHATGAKAARLVPGLPVTPRKGHLAITARYPAFLHHQLIELGYHKSAHSASADSVAFNVQPRKTGQVLIGSSRQFGATDKAVDRPILAKMFERAVEFMPALAGLDVIRCWTGFRAATPDQLPLIGPSVEDPRVWLATGHEGLGITTSLATACLIADLITGRTPPIPAEPYSPTRFAHA